MAKFIEVTISQDGNNATVTGHGFSGDSCVAAMADLENGLGRPRRERVMHEQMGTGQKQQITVEQ